VVCVWLKCCVQKTATAMVRVHEEGAFPHLRAAGAFKGVGSMVWAVAVDPVESGQSLRRRGKSAHKIRRIGRVRGCRRRIRSRDDRACRDGSSASWDQSTQAKMRARSRNGGDKGHAGAGMQARCPSDHTRRCGRVRSGSGPSALRLIKQRPAGTRAQARGTNLGVSRVSAGAWRT